MFIPLPGVDYNKDLENKPREKITVTIKEPLFKSKHNANEEIFVIPSLEGSDNDDQGHGSIGDATMEHVSRMQHRKLELDHYVHMPNGNIFTFQTDIRNPDVDGVAKISKDIVNIWHANDNMTIEEKEKLVNFFYEEIEENRKKREEKEDALENVTVPYEQWEQFPQQMSDWDVPSTPSDIAIFCGNTNQMFFDWFPEDHPDAKNINKFIAAVNGIDIDDFTGYTAEYFEGVLERMRWNIPTVQDHLLKFCRVIAESESCIPDDLMIETLEAIEADWREIYNKKSLETFNKNQITQRLNQLVTEIHESNDLKKIGALGKYLYSLPMDQVSRAHWAMYRDIKKKFAPKVIFGGIDINNCYLHDLRKLLKSLNIQVDRHQLEEVFFARPFYNLEEFLDLKLVSVTDIVGYNKNIAFVYKLKRSMMKAIELQNLYYLKREAPAIYELQENNPKLMSEEEWSYIWGAYRVFKKHVENLVGED